MNSYPGHLHNTLRRRGAGQPEPVRIVADVLQLLEAAGIRYCLLRRYPLDRRPHFDVDCVIEPAVETSELVEVLRAGAAVVGAELIRSSGRRIWLRDLHDRSLAFVLDVVDGLAVGSADLYAAEEILGRRRFADRVWVPSAAMEFCGALAKSFRMGRFDRETLERIRALSAEAPAECRVEAMRFWSASDVDLVEYACATKNPALLEQHSGRLARELRTHARFRNRRAYCSQWISRQAARVSRWRRPDGISIALLGPDGVGKSTAARLLAEQHLAGLFSGSSIERFVPPLRHLLFGGTYGSSPLPHQLKRRTPSASVLKALYWLAYSVATWPSRRLELARGRLIVFDRCILDALVDPVRYRYNGPSWLLRLISHLAPQPDVVVFLSAPAELVHSRKAELPIGEIDKQNASYACLARRLSNACTIDAQREPEQVARDIAEAVLDAVQGKLDRVRDRPVPAAGPAAVRLG